MTWSQILDLLESGLLRGREVGCLLVHALTLITHIFLTLCFLVFIVSLLLLFSFFSFWYSPFVIPCCCLLCTSMAFYTACCGTVYHFYPSTTLGLLCVFFQDYHSGLPAAQPSLLFRVGRATLHSQTKVVFVLFSFFPWHSHPDKACVSPLPTSIARI